MEAAGARLTSWIQVLLELQRDWTRHGTYDQARAIVETHGGGYRIGLAYARGMIHPTSAFRLCWPGCASSWSSNQTRWHSCARERSVGRKTASQLQSYGTRLRDDEPRLPRYDPRGGHDVAVVGRRVEKILYEERRRPVTEVQAAAQIH